MEKEVEVSKRTSDRSAKSERAQQRFLPDDI